MILVIDIGNTTMEFGLYEGDSLTGVFRLGSKRDITSDEVGLFVTQFFEYRKLSVGDVSDVIISSVVPQINYSVCSAVRKYFGLEPFVIGENIFCNMPNLYENPKEVGADRLVDSYAAFKKYGPAHNRRFRHRHHLRGGFRNRRIPRRNHLSRH